MAPDTYDVIETVEERALLVGIKEGRASQSTTGWTLEDSLAELRRLATTAGVSVVGTVTQRLEHPNPRTFVGAGKAAEIYDLAIDRNVTVIILMMTLRRVSRQTWKTP